MIDYLSKFLYILAGKKRILLFLSFLFLLSSMLEVVGIGLIGPFIALATKPELIYQNLWLNRTYIQLGFRSEVQLVSLLGLVVVSILYFKAVLVFNIQKYIFEFGFSQQADLRTTLMRAYLTVPYVFHLNLNTAILIQNIISETSNFANGVLMPILFTASNLTITCGLLLLLAKTDLAATVTILGVLLLSSSLYIDSKINLRWGKEGSIADAEMIRIINHGLGGLKETRIIGCESYFESQVSEQAERFKVAVAAYNTFSLLPRYVLESLLVTFLVGFTIISLVSNRSSQSLTASLGIFGLASIRLLPIVSSLMQAFSSIKRSSYIVDKLYFDLKELEEVEVRENLKHSPRINKRELSSSKNYHKQVMPFTEQIVLDKVTYRYPNVSDPALKDIYLEIKKGQSIGLIGKSGAGKTTLVDVILGLLTPESGDIKVDGISIESDRRSWQNLIGYIPQSIFLIDDTIERNIAFGVPDAQIDQRRLEKAIHAAQLTEVVNQLPDGTKTVVGERGVRLSGGQRQRVGIARTLYHEKQILVLDEATAALDNETESLVSEAIKSLSSTKTMIIIAHRLSTIEHCDRIYLIEKGQVVKAGSYQEVVLGQAVH